MPRYEVSFCTESIMFSENGGQTVEFEIVKNVKIRATCKKQAITLAQKALIRKYNPTSWGINEIKKIKS